MPHFGKSNHQFRTSLDSTKQYRITAWLSFKQTWNDAEKRFEKNTPEEISICRKLFEQLAQHPGLQLQLNIDERMSGIDDVKQTKLDLVKFWKDNSAQREDLSNSDKQSSKETLSWITERVKEAQTFLKNRENAIKESEK